MKLNLLKGHYQKDNKACGALCTLAVLFLKGKRSTMPLTEEQDSEDVWGELKFTTEEAQFLGVTDKESSPLKIIDFLGTKDVGSTLVLDSMTYRHSIGLHDGLMKMGQGFLAAMGASKVEPTVVSKWENSITLKTDELYLLTVILVNHGNVPSGLTHWIMASADGGNVDVYDPAGGEVKTFSKDSFKGCLQGIGHFDVGQRYIFSGVALKVH